MLHITASEASPVLFSVDCSGGQATFFSPFPVPVVNSGNGQGQGCGRPPSPVPA